MYKGSVFCFPETNGNKTSSKENTHRVLTKEEGLPMAKRKELNIKYVPYSTIYTEEEITEAQKEQKKVIEFLLKKLIYEVATAAEEVSEETTK